MTRRDDLYHEMTETMGEIPSSQVTEAEISELLVILLRIRRRLEHAESYPAQGLRLV